ncbi:hypothetical protein BVH01_23155 [Pseudomonas sp. PA1(2017)]|nr:hypothetical protein BVH01_23155 [Pseudomonas sp. PA1(2017)]
MQASVDVTDVEYIPRGRHIPPGRQVYKIQKMLTISEHFPHFVNQTTSVSALSRPLQLQQSLCHIQLTNKITRLSMKIRTCRRAHLTNLAQEN